MSENERIETLARNVAKYIKAKPDADLETVIMNEVSDLVVDLNRDVEKLVSRINRKNAALDAIHTKDLTASAILEAVNAARDI